MNTIHHADQLKLDGSCIPITTYKFSKPITEMRKIIEDNRVECEHCGIIRHKRRMVSSGEHYATPWDKIPEEPRWYCSQEHMDESMFESGSFDYFICEGCCRIICEQNPKQGHHVQYRVVDSEPICLSCYEEMILRDGQPLSDFLDDDGKPQPKIIGGMFFSTGNPEPKEAGYEELDAPSFIRFDASRFNKCAAEYIEQGWQVVVGYGSIGMGLEGTVTLLGKKTHIGNVL